MSKKILILWIIIVVGLFGIVLILGFKQKDLAYIKLEYDIRLATRRYIKEKNIKIKLSESYNVYIDDLKDEKNIKSELISKYCIKGINVFNGLIFNEYTLIKECNKEEK